VQAGPRNFFEEHPYINLMTGFLVGYFGTMVRGVCMWIKCAAVGLHDAQTRQSSPPLESRVAG
jgi:hypothetical protein